LWLLYLHCNQKEEIEIKPDINLNSPNSQNI
jgi:hypothetical protein